MTRIFLPLEQLASDELVITGNNARHLALVLRIEAGAPLEVLDGEPVAVTLCQGIARGEKMDLIIQKSTELGVNKIIPVITERSQVRNTNKLERWRKIATSAAEQSGRDRVPEILEPVVLNEFLVTPYNLPLNKKGKQDGLLKLILSASYKEQNMKEMLTADMDIKQILLLIGPEGGFSQEEITRSAENGFMEVSLGPRILRTETAPITTLSIIQYELGDMG